MPQLTLRDWTAGNLVTVRCLLNATATGQVDRRINYAASDAVADKSA